MRRRRPSGPLTAAGYRGATVARVEFRPFSDEHLEGAARLLAERHDRHRAVEPLLPAAGDVRVHVAREWGAGDTGGAVALEGGEVIGYLVGERREDTIGPHVWSHLAGHAVRTPEHVRDLYRIASGRWLEDGISRHFVFVPALPELIDPWFRLGFGASAALAARKTGPETSPASGVNVRPSTPDDLQAAASFDRLLGEHLARPPSFGGLPVPVLREYVDDWRNIWADDRFVHFVAEREGRIAGHLLLYRRPPDLRVPPDSIDLANAATDPAARGSGAMLALTAHALTWAHEHGFPTMITDWRMTNLEASRFWPRRGFREVFLRLYRSIP
jgi:GNAT superfamily N-acetyltransferase